MSVSLRTRVSRSTSPRCLQIPNSNKNPPKDWRQYMRRRRAAWSPLIAISSFWVSSGIHEWALSRVAKSLCLLFIQLDVVVQVIREMAARGMFINRSLLSPAPPAYFELDRHQPAAAGVHLSRTSRPPKTSSGAMTTTMMTSAAATHETQRQLVGKRHRWRSFDSSLLSPH